MGGASNKPIREKDGEKHIGIKAQVCYVNAAKIVSRGHSRLQAGLYEGSSATMRDNNARTRITVDLGSTDLYRALKFAAVERDVAAREIVVEALLEWLERNQPTVANKLKVSIRDH